MTNRRRPGRLKSPKITDRAWRYYNAADSIYQRRINYFLVAESMLLFAFITAFLSETKLNEIQILISLVAITITLSWYYINARIAHRADLLKEKYLAENDPVHWDYINSVICIREDIFSSYILPFGVLFLWLYLLVFSIFPNLDLILKIINLIILINICVLVSLVIRIATRRNF